MTRARSKRPARRSSPRTPSSPAPREDKLFPVVGIGASAGGLEAFSNLLTHLPQNTGMAFVLVQHLDPKHSSALEEILSRTTKLPVAQVTSGTAVQPNHVYVIPANADMIIKDGVLQLSARTLDARRHRPIDTFLHSLADDAADQSIAVILSGTASDGTAGCGAIKAAGGITFAQDERSAKFPDMPRSAIDAGCIDVVLPPDQIAHELARIGSHPHVAKLRPRSQLPLVASEAQTRRLFSMLRGARGLDFTHYKQTTIQRRIKRRMVLSRADKMEDYIRFVMNTPSELDDLYRDLLIHVTEFFRDPGTFESLARHVYPIIFKDRNPSDAPVRIWVPACSTGEEAYSVAISIFEFLGSAERDNSIPIQIFATDVREDALERARSGHYPESALAHLSPAIVKRFFVRANGGYQVIRPIREICVFAKQNVIKDPPFSNLDLISCRNLLIYFGTELQKRFIPALHYALKPNGFLALGTSESLGAFADYFTLIDKKYRVYQKKKSSARLITYFTGGEYSSHRLQPARPVAAPPAALNVEKEVERVLVNRFVPASIVVNSEMEIVQFRGKTGAYLEPASGHPTFSLSKMVREGLLIDLRAALHKAKSEQTVVRKEGVSVRSNSGSQMVDLEVIPVQGQGSADRFYVIVFQDHHDRTPRHTAAKPAKSAKAEAPLVRENARLERELSQLREQLQALIEDHEMTTEEFKTANEEVLSSNEELQSTNEELETAKEELQSANEELTTMNEEVQNRNAEILAVNNDLLNLFANANLTVVMVSANAAVRRFTPPAEKLLNLLPSDIGRRLGEIRPNLEIDNLEQVAREVMRNPAVYEREVREPNGPWYLMRARPYRTGENRVEGAVLSFQDIDAMKRTLDATKLYADMLIESAREPLLVLDDRLRVVAANTAFYNSFHVAAKDTINRLIFDLGNRQWDIPALRTLLQRITNDNARVDDFEVRHNFEHIGERTMLLNARRLQPAPNQTLVFLSMVDVSPLKQSEENLRRLSAYLMSVQDEERRRFARELHDSTGQKLAVAKLNLDTLVKSPQHKDSHKLVSEAAQWLDEAFKEIRTVSHLLHPPLLDEAGLVSATRWLADGFSQRSKIRTDLQVQGTIGRLDQAVELALFRVIQEALSNVHRHSGAKHAQILLALSPEAVTLEIRDDGKGIPNEVLSGESYSAEKRLGVGVLGMRERLAQLGGSLEIDTGKHGTTIRALVPNRVAKGALATAD